MSLNSTKTKETYNGDGTTVVFDVTFKFVLNSHVVAILRDSDGNETTWVEGTQYTLTGAGDENGGELTVNTSPVDYTPQSGETLTIKRAVPETQLTELPLGGTLPSTTIEQMVDLLTMMVQAHSEEIARSVLLSATSQSSDISIPDPEAAKFLRWNAAATDLENAEITGSGSIGIPVSLAQGGTNATTAADARTNLGLRTAAVKDTGTSGDAVPLLDQANSFSGTVTLDGKPVEFAEGAAVASAGTTDIWTPDDGNTVHITGTTTITSFGTAPQAGAMRLVIFDGALTLTHGASLILPGAANITTAAGDSALVYADSTTVMRVVFYQLAAPAPFDNTLPPPDFESTGQTPAADTTLDIAHGLGAIPTLWGVWAKCIDVDLGYAVGDEVSLFSMGTEADTSATAYADDTNITLIQGVQPIRVIDQGTKNNANGQVTDWEWVARAWL